MPVEGGRSVPAPPTSAHTRGAARAPRGSGPPAAERPPRGAPCRRRRAAPLPLAQAPPPLLSPLRHRCLPRLPAGRLAAAVGARAAAAGGCWPLACGTPHVPRGLMRRSPTSPALPVPVGATWPARRRCRRRPDRCCRRRCARAHVRHAHATSRRRGRVAGRDGGADGGSGGGGSGDVAPFGRRRKASRTLLVGPGPLDEFVRTALVSCLFLLFLCCSPSRSGDGTLDVGTRLCAHKETSRAVL